MDDINSHVLNKAYFESALDTFRSLNNESVLKMINQAKTKTRMFNPTYLFKLCLDELAQSETEIINTSLITALILASLNHAIISLI